MRGSLACTLTGLAAVAVAVPSGPAAAAVPVARRVPHAGSPTAAQIHRAVADVAHSSSLWATINICLPEPQRGGTIGVRGEMPTLGFRATLSMTIQLDQYLPTEKREVAVPGATARRTVTIGPRRTGIDQDGVEFPYASETGTLSATVTFTWTRAGRQLARLTRATTAGHHSAAYGEPPGYSSATCRL